MAAESLSPDLVDDEELVKDGKILHIRNFVVDRALCGVPRDPGSPVLWDMPPGCQACVVCWDLWWGMSPSEKARLIEFWS